MLVRKVDELFPVVGGDVVLARADMVADSPMNLITRLFDDPNCDRTIDRRAQLQERKEISLGSAHLSSW